MLPSRHTVFAAALTLLGSFACSEPDPKPRASDTDEDTDEDSPYEAGAPSVTAPDATPSVPPNPDEQQATDDDAGVDDAGPSATSPEGSGAESAEPDAAPTLITDGAAELANGELGPCVPGEPDCACAEALSITASELTLAFVVDRSGSMGADTQPWHRRDYKWDPVVEGTADFFEQAGLSGVSAMLTVFPPADFGGGGFGTGEACAPEDYESPDLALTPLPSTDFRLALGAATPSGGWPLAAPTHAALEATLALVDASSEAAARKALVLIADGPPSQCDDSAATVDGVAALLTAVQSELPTFVVGVENPATEAEANPPDDVAPLTPWAEAGGTSPLRRLATDDPATTPGELTELLTRIAAEASACHYPLPEDLQGSEPATTSARSTIGDIAYAYDETCSRESAWRFVDDGAAIELCPSACLELLRSGAESRALSVAIGCE